MCIAVYKPQGVNPPSKEIFKRCFLRNSDGAGYMYTSENKVHIRKGFMTFKDFWKSLNKTKKQLGGNAIDTPFVYHFRISTQGGVNKGLTHPYPLCSNYNTMKIESSCCDFGVAHNGIISATSSYLKSDHNDTMEFIKEIASRVIKTTSWYKNKNIVGLLEYILEGNRLAVLDKEGHCELLGKWTESDGVYYSNDGFKETRAVAVSSSWRHFSDYYDEYDDEYWWNKAHSSAGTSKSNSFEEDYPTPKDDETIDYEYNPLSIPQRQELEQLGSVSCENCGEPLVLDYDTYDKTYYLYCPCCGEIYGLTNEELKIALEDMNVRVGG